MIIAALWKFDVRHVLIALNIVAFGILIVYLIYATLSPRRAQKEEKPAPNMTPFLDDDDLEGRRLERVQGWALIFAAVVAIALPIYWLREPDRQHEIAHYFDKNSVHRGAVLFASPGTPDYDAATSKQCANCHGAKGEGGSAPYRIKGVQVSWKAPPLNTEALRFTQDPKCADPSAKDATTICEISDIITYGRPGTPMQGWGVAGGGPLNDQAINDLVAYIKSIQLTPEQAKAQATKDLAAANADSGSCPEYMTCPKIALGDAQKKLEADQKALDEAEKAARAKIPDAPEGTDALRADCRTITSRVPKNPADVKEPLKSEAIACAAFETAAKKVDDSKAAVAWDQEWLARRANVSEGQILFETYCARCHTQGWSVFDPTQPPSALNGVNILGLSGGGGGTNGGIGFNLRDGDTTRRFGSDEAAGWQKQFDFVTAGSNPFQGYGNNGMGSGRMPGFGDMLTPDQIAMIVSYERYCLEATDYTAVSPVCETPTHPKTAPTTTTLAPSKG